MSDKMMRVSYGEALVELGKRNDKVVVLDADLAHATFTGTFQKEFPDRFFNVGIAEANLVDMSVGMSAMGYVPFCSTFALFGAGRAYEQIRNSVAYPKMNVKICCTHGGITVGEDGGSHQSIEDFALMRVIPGMTVVIPGDANETEKAVLAAAEHQGPLYMRIGRSPSRVLPPQPFEIGKANVLKDGSDIVLFACGIMVPEALDVAEALEEKGYSTAVVNMHTIKPLDEECVLKYAEKCRHIVTMEEHSVIGGLGDAVGSVLLEKCPKKLLKIGVQDRFGQSGKPCDLMDEYGLSAKTIIPRILEML
ncbi:MAG: transketolase family protein [Candidatus Ornithospirochaeta sp.]